MSCPRFVGVPLAFAGSDWCRGCFYWRDGVCGYDFVAPPLPEWASSYMGGRSLKDVDGGKRRVRVWKEKKA